MASEESAREHLDNAIAAYLAEDQRDIVIAECEQALALGLEGDYEGFARVLLGNTYGRIALDKDLPEGQLITLPEWTRAESEITAGLRVDREGGHGYFASRDGRVQLQTFDNFCVLAARARAEEDPRAAITYLSSILATSAVSLEAWGLVP